MRMRKKPNLSARMEKCAHLLAAAPEEFRGRWLERFGYSGLHVELGCGKGRFTVERAKVSQAVLFVALEKSADAMITALERAAAAELQNIRFANAFADNLTDYFAPDEISRIYINFCDPWPSNGHAKRRLTYRLFLERYKQALRPGGDIQFKTDNLPLFEFSLHEFSLCGFTPSEVIYDLHKNGPAGVMTDYELKFYNQGSAIYKCIMQNA